MHLFSTCRRSDRNADRESSLLAEGSAAEPAKSPLLAEEKIEFTGQLGSAGAEQTQSHVHESLTAMDSHGQLMLSLAFAHATVPN